MYKILIINGPNLNLLGTREPELYGKKRFDVFFEKLKTDFFDTKMTYFQSNIEGELINKLHEVGFDYDGIVFNPAGYTHTSIALADAVAAITTPVIEVHITNTHAREPFRQRSYIAQYAVGQIVGLGLEGYRLAISYLLKHKIANQS